jgi:hypothetical protein
VAHRRRPSLAHSVGVIPGGWRQDAVTCDAGGKYGTRTDDLRSTRADALSLKIDLVAVQQKIPLVRTCVAFRGCGQPAVETFPEADGGLV